MPTSVSDGRNSRLELFATTAPGLESITAGELKTLRIRGRQVPGGVAFDGDLESVCQANLWLRTASRIVVRLGHFHASTFYELERRAKKLPWTAFLPVTGSVELRVTCRKSRLYHSDAVAERILGAIARVAPHGVDLQIGTPREDAETENDTRHEDVETESDSRRAPVQLFVVRIVNDECEISADTSGALLHRRGYRQEVAKAPLRETLAAAMVLASGWRKENHLVDPMCGSGTIPIEAALIAHRKAPGLGRSFQFMNWPSFDRRLWTDVLGKAKDSIVEAQPDIRAADRDAGAIQSAMRNAERAGVASSIQFSTEAVSGSFAALEDVANGEGWIITNPPYGIRVGESSDLRNLYATLGAALKGKGGWRLGILAADETLPRQIRVRMRSRFATTNGGIPVSYLVSERVGETDASRRKARVRQGAGEE